MGKSGNCSAGPPKAEWRIGGLPDPALRVKLVHGLVDFPLDHQLRGLGGPLCCFIHGLLFLLGEP